MASSCDMCAHYVYDEEDDFSECLVNMDEDDFARFIARGYDNCPYFQYIPGFFMLIADLQLSVK